MSATGLEQFDRALQTANIWLGEMMRLLGSDRATAWRALGAVLHTLRDRLTSEQVAHLGGQLPLIIRGLLYEQWHPTSKQSKFHTQEEFVAHVREQLTAKHSVDAKRATQAVFSILLRHPKGETLKVLETLPPDIRSLSAPNAAEDEISSSFEWE